MPATPPNFVAAREHVLGEVTTFVRRLRRQGVSVPANAALSTTEALVEAGLADRDRVRAATHATLVTDPRETAVFDDLFPEFWYRLRTGLEATATADDVGDRAASGALATREVPESDGERAERDDTGLESDGPGGVGDERHAAPATRRLLDHDVDADTDSDDSELGREETHVGAYSNVGEGSTVEDDPSVGGVDDDAVRAFERALSTLSGRRWSRRQGRRVDARRALRESVSTGGTVVSLPRRGRKPNAFRTTVLVDVSRSVLDSVDRGLLLGFLDRLVTDGRGVRVFFFDTEIREVTSVFATAGADPEAALADAEISWGGGTKIGGALATLRTQWPDAVDRRTVTVVVSDGLDVGDVDHLEREMTWLAARSKAVVWLNPLAASPRYEPTCRGMAAARPYVDGLFAFAGSDDLVETARQLRRHRLHGPIGYEHDFRNRVDAGEGSA